MPEDLLYRLSQTTPLARRLLAALVLVFVPLLAIFTIALPLLETREAGAARLAEAEAVHLWIYGHASALPPGALDGSAAPVQDGPAAPVGISELETGLVAAGLRDRVARLANNQGGAVEIGFEEVPFRALTDWLDANASGWGYDFARFTIERAEIPGHVTALIELVPAQ